MKPEPAHMPPDVQETTYFVYYSHGEKPDTPWEFSLYFKVHINLHNINLHISLVMIKTVFWVLLPRSDKPGVGCIKLTTRFVNI